MPKKIFDYIKERMLLPTYVYTPRIVLFSLCFSICIMWWVAIALWHSIFVILSIFILLISILWGFFVYKFWKIYYSPIAFAIILCIGAGLIILLKICGGFV